ncbi:MAG: type II toxin-antitoxin system PemK/MazF family toxin [Spirochaetales bacterium]|nr:type II toxin-antitoxin system PemK/MazF family toxin [Spirochaetales bacterium]
MKCKKFDIWLADLSPRFGAEPGKTRPVIIIQTDLLPNTHPTVIILPITSQVHKKVTILRVHLNQHINGLKSPSDILIDQVRSIDKKRLQRKLGTLTEHQKEKVLKNTKILVLE